MRAFRIAYDGADYRGYQRQPHGNTVENALFRALDALDVTDGGKPSGYTAAGRTDAGVSAIQQTVTLDAPAWLTARPLNAELPADIRVWATAPARDGFHATHEARRRVYDYHLHAPGADDEQVRRALDRLSGHHDFHNLTLDDSGTERELTASVERDGVYLVCRFAAGGFPREFVRRAVGLVAEVASGERDLAFVDRALSAERLQGPAGIAPAAPEPLLLRKVAYDLEFTVDTEAAASAKAVFEQRRIRRQTGARVADQLGSLGSHDP